MSLVTIDDKITRLHEHSVSIEIVERVERHIFYTAGSSVPLEHVDENSLWVRGQHLLDSDEVKAARSAMALSDKKPADPLGMGVEFIPNPMPALGPAPDYGFPVPPNIGDVMDRLGLGQTATGPFDAVLGPRIIRKT